MSLSCLTWRKAILWFGSALIIFLFLSASHPLLAEGTNTAPAQPQPASADGEDFGKYLTDHQADIAPFFQKHTDDLVKQAVPLLIAVLVNVVLLNVVIGWFFNVGISYGFSTLFAPAYAKIKRALIYATGHLVLGGIIGILTVLVGVVVGMAHSPLLLVLSVIIVVLIDFAAQTFWVIAIYRTNPVVAGLFYLSLLGVHIIAGTLLSGSLVESRVKSTLIQFVDQNVTTQIKASTSETKHDLALAEEARDKVQAELNDAQGRLTQATADKKAILKEIEQKKNSEVFVYGRAVRVHAEGDLVKAQADLTAFLTQFPSGTFAEQAKQQLAQVESEIAAGEAQKKQAEADAALAAAQARADLLARAAKEGVTLSEMRQAIVGKTRADVTALFGLPTETASDRWGYSQLITRNPLTNEKHGLTIYFNEGVVQSIDYYYGSAGQ